MQLIDTMALTVYSDAAAFLAVARPFLEEHEAENILILGVAARLARTPGGEPYFAAVEREGAVVAAAMRTPPFNLVLTRMTDESLMEILNDLVVRGTQLPGVLGPRQESRLFAQIWGERTGAQWELRRNERIHQLDRVIDPEPVAGRLRPATVEDESLVVDWTLQFGEDVGQSAHERARAREIANAAIADGRLYLWEDETPLSMAASARGTANSATINSVYTPPELRGRGYASACVAALSRRLLDSGFRSCVLYTDLANPTSNSIYRKIGYRAICDVDEYRFVG